MHYQNLDYLLNESNGKKINQEILNIEPTDNPPYDAHAFTFFPGVRVHNAPHSHCNKDTAQLNLIPQ